MYTWKKRNGSKATYTKMIKIFEQAGYKTYADEVRKIAHISNSDTDDSSDSGEEHPQIEQPQTYPDYKPRALPRVPQPMTSTELTEVYVMVKEENLPKGIRIGQTVQDYNYSINIIGNKINAFSMYVRLCRNICLYYVWPD